MAKVLQLNQFRKQKRQLFYRKNGDKLERFIHTFLTTHLNIDFSEITERYLCQQRYNNEQSWDYLDLRDILREAFSATLGATMKTELQGLWWFDLSTVSVEEMIDRCLSAYILQHSDVAKSSNQ